MRNQPTLDIKVVYSASRRHRGGGWARRASVTRWPFLLLGLLNLAAASGLYYATWWRVDPGLVPWIIMKTPLPGMDVDAVSAIFGPPRATAGGRRPSSDSTPTRSTETSASTDQAAIDSALVPAIAYGWLTLATLASCALALAAGTSLGHVTGPLGRRIAVILLVLTLGGLCLAGLAIWNKYQWRYEPAHLRAGMGGLVLIGALIGQSVGRGVRAWTYIAAFALIISALGSVAGLYVGDRCGAVNQEDWPVSFFEALPLIFLVHSFWGWVLLPVAARIGR